MRFSVLLSITTSTIILSIPTANAQSFEDLGYFIGGSTPTFAMGISRDGSVVIGRSQSTNGTEAFRWTSGTGMIGLGDLPGGAFSSRAWGISGDGTIIIGEATSASGTEAFRWQNGVMTGLGDLPGGMFNSIAYGINNDGTIIVGSSSSTNGTEAFRWQNGVMTGLGDLPGSLFSSTARATNADGSVIVGYSYSTNGLEAFRWENGVMTGLGDLAGGPFFSTATDVNSDGSVVVGLGNSVNGNEAYRWENGVMTGLGDLAGGSFFSSASAVNSNGNVIVGTGTSAIGSEAIRWTAANGMESLNDILNAAGVDITGYTLTSANDVDDSGNIIIGAGSFGGNTISFIANLSTNGLTTPENLAKGLASGAVPIQQSRSATINNLSQSLFAATQSSILFKQNDFIQNLSSESSVVSPAAGDEEYTTIYEHNLARRWAAYSVGSFGIGHNNNTDNSSLNGTTGLMMKVNKSWTIGLGAIGSYNISSTSYDGESKLNAFGGALITSYENDAGLMLHSTIFGAHLNVDTKRNYLNGAAIDSSRGETNGVGYGGALRAGWKFDFNDIKVTPYGEIFATKTQLDPYTETNGAFPATYGESENHQTITKLGTQISYDVSSSLSVSTRVALAHRVNNGEGGITASTTGFTGTIANPTGDRNWAELALQTNWNIAANTHLNTELSGRSGRTEDPAGALSIGISKRF